ncbi:MAG: glycosyltransferase family 39 protein [Anaerolineaceae bacterium]|nr:glycosyltransferase family 39 protein [Anaerolineaceae bacterium]
MTETGQSLPGNPPDESLSQSESDISAAGSAATHLHIDVDLAPGATILARFENKLPGGEAQVTVQSSSGQYRWETVQRPTASPMDQMILAWLRRIFQAARTALTLETGLFGSALGLYLLTRLMGLANFPIYFFTDEAVQTMLASDLIRDHLYGADHVFLPTFFLNSYQYNLGVSVYLQLIPYLTVGRQIWATRGICVLVTLLAAISVGLILKNIFHSPYAWAAVLLLSITPAWFLHSRTAFETSLAVTFYAAMIYFYLCYRSRSPHYLYPTVVMAALCIYSYSPAEMVVFVTVLLFFLSDFRFHWQQRRTILFSAAFGLFLLVPMLRFQLVHPEENLNHLEVLNSYWIQPISTLDKISTYIGEYLKGLSPLYWYLPNNVDLSRHVMKDYSHVLLATLPLALLGIGTAIRRIRFPLYRSLLLVFLAAPSGAALVALGITRALFMVIPLALFSAIGLTVALQWIERHWQARRAVLALPVFILMAGFNGYMLNDALVNGPLWFNDYSLNGMQFGAQQLFGVIKDYLAQNPQVQLVVSPSWANGTDTVARYFFGDPLPFEMGSIDGYINQYQEIDANTLFVMIPSEYQDMLLSGKFTDISIEKILPYPDGKPGFYFVHLRYVDHIDQTFAQEEAARQVLQQAVLTVDGGPAQVSYSFLDMGPIDNIFDKDSGSLIRTLEANPLVVQIDFEQPHAIKGLTVHVGGVETEVKVILQDADSNLLLSADQTVPEVPDPRDASFDFNTTYPVSHLRLEVRNVNDGVPSHVHLWQVTFK